MVQPLQYLYVPAERFLVAAPVQHRVGEAHVHPAPALIGHGKQIVGDVGRVRAPPHLLGLRSLDRPRVDRHQHRGPVAVDLHLDVLPSCRIASVMDSSLEQIAQAFSSHRFAETYRHLAQDVVWENIGGSTLRGRSAVIEACEQSDAYLSQVASEFIRFRTVVGDEAVVIDSLARYVDATGRHRSHRATSMSSQVTQ